jgi:hypothetical protein
MSAKAETPLLLAPLLPLHCATAELEAEALNNRLCLAPCTGGLGGGWGGLEHYATPQRPPVSVSTRHSAGQACLVPRSNFQGPPPHAAYLPKRGKHQHCTAVLRFADLALPQPLLCSVLACLLPRMARPPLPQAADLPVC